MLKRGFGKKNLVGVDIGSSSVKAVELVGKPGSLQLVSLGYENLQTDCIAAGVSGHSVIVKNIVGPQMSADELEESIEWHAEEHIPFDISDVSLDYQVTGSSPDALQVLMAACKRDKIANVKQAIQLAGKQPAIIDVDAFALQNCYEANYQPQPGQVVALLNIGAATMNINILSGNKSVFTRDVSVGGNQYTALLQKELDLTFEQAEAVKRGLPAPDGKEVQDFEQMLETASDILALEISKTMDFYRATAEDGDGNVQKILISGGGSKLIGLSDYLAKRFEIPVEVVNPFRQIKVDARRFDPDYMREVVPEMAIAVGLALRGVDAQ